MPDQTQSDGADLRQFLDAVKADDRAAVRAMLRRRPQLVHMDAASNDERRAIHYAVLQRLPAMTRLLMEAGSDAHKGIYPHRDATTAYRLAVERGFDEIVAMIDEEEKRRREALNCPNVTVEPAQQRVNAALREGRDDEAIAMMEADGSLIRTCDDSGATVLHVAARHYREKVVHWLVGRGASLRKRDGNGLLPIDRPIRHVHWRHRDRIEPARQMVQLLRQRGSELTPAAAVVLGELAALRRMLDEQPDLQKQTTTVHDGDLLTWAVMFDQLDALRLLLQSGFDPDARVQLPDLETPTYSWGHPLWIAAAWDCREAAKVLLDHRADPSAKVYASGDPLARAYGAGHDEMVKLLLGCGAVQRIENIGLHDDVDAARAWFDGRLDARPYDPDEDPLRAMLWAAACAGSEGIVEMCLQRLDWADDDLRWREILGQPLRMHRHGPHQVHKAGDRGIYARTLKRMLDHGAEVNLIGRFGATLMHDVAACGFCWGQRVMQESERVEFATLLLEYGGRLDLRDELLQSTPLGWACRWGCVELVSLYLDRGAAANEPDAEPWATPLAWAKKMGHAGVASLLQSRGAQR